MNAYVAELNRAIPKHTDPNEPVTLKNRFREWYRSLPSVTRDRPFSMSEFETAMKTQGKYISSVLLELGWQRKRKWDSTGHYHRYWLPPASQC